jgi:hypothetical protein
MAQLRRNRLSRGAAFAQVLTNVKTRPCSEENNIYRWPQLAGDQPVKTEPTMCTIREFGVRMYKEFTTRQIFGFVHPYAITHRGHGHSIGKGAES